jgi:glucose/arabinose dehydrogenase
LACALHATLRLIFAQVDMPVRITRIFIAALLVMAACSDSNDITAPSASIQCSPNNAGLTLPTGFCAVVVADLTNSNGGKVAARHLAVLPNGDVFVAINSPNNNQPEFGIIGLRDTDDDGDADTQTEFSPDLGGSGIAWAGNRLFFGANDRVLRFNVTQGQLTPTGTAEVVVSGLPNTGDHISKTVVLSNDGKLFVNIGSASNACQVNNRQLQSPGQAPCPELPVRAGVWMFDANGTNMTQANGTRYATGYRNLVALAIDPADNTLYGVQHGRDMLFENWPAFYTVDEDAVLPAEEFVRITQNSNNGWPYCYFDAVFEKKKVLAPEYGGNGTLTSGGTSPVNCAEMNQPLATFGAHWAPNGVTFYSGNQFPEKYRGGAFVAFHGGFDRSPLPNEGYNVMFVPVSNGTAGTPEIFADGFAASTGVLPNTAQHRPVGITMGPDGSLYISDDRGGRIYRIIFRGQ